MEIRTPSSSHSSPSPPLSGAFWSLFWGQGLWWLISALSGTLEIKAEGKRQQQEHEFRMKTLQQENERLDGMLLQTRKENEQLAILESKIDGLFSKYNINSKVHRTPEQPWGIFWYFCRNMVSRRAIALIINSFDELRCANLFCTISKLRSRFREKF